MNKSLCKRLLGTGIQAGLMMLPPFTHAQSHNLLRLQAVSLLRIRGAKLDVGQDKPSDKAAVYEKAFQKIVQTVAKEFYDKRLHNVDWNKVTETYKARLSSVHSKAEFEALMNQMLAELHASHMGFVTDDDAEYYMLGAVAEQDMQRHVVEHIGVTGRQEGDAYLVSAVLNDGPADKAGILSGDRLLLADGRPFTTAGSFRGKVGVSVEVQLQRAGEAKPRTVRVVPVKQNMLRSFLDATRRSARVMNVGDRKIGYVHLWTMAHDVFRTTLENIIVTRLHDTNGLILDLRDGYGGRPFGFSDVFFRPDVSWETQYHAGITTVQHTGYAKPVVVLINEGTRSAKEFFAYQMKTSHRATLVGTRTAGAFLGAGFVPIGDNALLELAEVGLKVNGQPLENTGVSPDINVVPKDIYTEQDAQLAQAKQTLVSLLPPRSQEMDKPAVIHVH